MKRKQKAIIQRNNAKKIKEEFEKGKR